MTVNANVLAVAKYIDRCIEQFGFTTAWSDDQDQQARQLWQQCQQEAEAEVAQREVR